MRDQSALWTTRDLVKAKFWVTTLNTFCARYKDTNYVWDEKSWISHCHHSLRWWVAIQFNIRMQYSQNYLTMNAEERMEWRGEPFYNLQFCFCCEGKQVKLFQGPQLRLKAWRNAKNKTTNMLYSSLYNKNCVVQHKIKAVGWGNSSFSPLKDVSSRSS